MAAEPRILKHPERLSAPVIPAPHTLDHRTRVLTGPSPYLSGAHTRALTGHTQPTLARLVDEGELTARKLSARLTFQTASVVAYCRRKGMTVSLFDRLVDAEGERITECELEFDLARARSGTWWTLARREHAPPDWPTWKAWYSGDTDASLAGLAARREVWAHQVKDQKLRGLLRRTLWVSPHRLGHFGAYSLAQYEQVSAAQGVVRVLPVRTISPLEHQRALPDLEVNPQAVHVRCLNRVGSRDGAVRITDPELVATTAAFLGWADRQHALPLTEFIRERQLKVA